MHDPEPVSRRQLILASAATAGGALGGWLGPSTLALAGDETDWPLRPAPDAGIDPAALQRILDDARAFAPLRSLLVVRHGALIAEHLGDGTSATELQALNSITKSVASMLVGISLDQGRLPGLSATLGELLPEAVAKAPDSRVAAITLEQILTGTTGLVYDFARQLRALDSAEDPVAFTLGLDIDPALPHPWVYNDAAVSLLTPILERAHGRPVEEIATRHLFGPLGIVRFSGQRDRTGRVMSYRGLRLGARDLARLAWTMADDGRWNGAAVVPADWVRASTRPHVPTTWGVVPMRRTGYGYLWFTGTLGGHPVAWAWGYGAQFALVAPSLRLAVTTTATVPRGGDAMPQNHAVMTLVARIVALAA